MNKVKVSEATNTQLDWLVAKCEGYEVAFDSYGVIIRRMDIVDRFEPTIEWGWMGPIIKRQLLQVNPHFLSAGYQHPKGLWEWEAYVLGPTSIDDNYEQHGPTPLIAAARCYVASKLGEEVEVPEELG